MKNFARAFAIALLLCLFTVALNIFKLKKDIAKTQYINTGLNVPNNAPLVVYQTALVGHWLVMGLKTYSSHVHARLSKMDVAIENIASLVAISNLVVNQLMECETTAAITTKATFAEEPKWTTMMVKNVRQVVSWVVETLADTPKQEEREFNLCRMSFEAKEGETKKELV